MKKMLAMAITVSLALGTTTGFGLTVVSRIGDVDAFSPGDPEDVPFRSQNVLDALAAGGSLPPIDLDQPLVNQRIGFTHSFVIPSGQSIVGATLTVGQHPTPTTYTPSDCLRLDVGVDAK